MPEPIHTLGINAAFHDSAACLVRDGIVIAAAEDERFTHVKHAKRPVPFSTWSCLPCDRLLSRGGRHRARGRRPRRVFVRPVVRADRDTAEPSLTLPLSPSARAPRNGGASPWHPLFLSSIVNAPRQLAGGAPHHLQRRFRGVTHDGPFRWHFVEHHLAHEASAFLAAPFARCAVMTMDGRGERATTSYGAFDGRSYRRLGKVNLPHSLGLLYERVTRYLGFLHSSDEYKVMALASYGKPVFADAMRKLVRYDGDGRYAILDGDLVAMFGPPRERRPIEPHHCDIAHALQRVLEETALQAVDWLAAGTGERQLAMAGGVALNCVMNAKIRDRGPFDDVWVQPAAGDAGTALGAALWTDFRMRGERGAWRMEHAYLGPSYGDDAIEAFLKDAQLPYRRLADVAAQTAALLAANRVIGWFQGAWSSARALGARSILASPTDPDMQRKLQDQDREDFRPVAPVVLARRITGSAADGARLRAPFMLFVYDVAPGAEAAIPAVRHIDGTARVQTVDEAQHPLLHALLTEFDALTGVPVLVNTSFNTRGEPIVCTPRDALECFWTSPLDALVIGSFLLEKPR